MPNGRGQREMFELCEVIGGFRRTHGRWPTHVSMPPNTARDIEHEAGAESWARLRSAVEIVAGESGVEAIGADDRRFRISAGTPTEQRHADGKSGAAWLGRKTKSDLRLV